MPFDTRLHVPLIAACLAFVPASLAQTAPHYVVTDLGTLGGNSSEAYAISSSGQLVGVAKTIGGFSHAFRTAPNAAINPATDDLGTFGGSFSYALDINNSGQVVGYAGTGANFDQYYHAFRTAPNAAINPATDDLGLLTGYYSIAYSINDSGQVVGAAQVDPLPQRDYWHAFRTAANAAINPLTDDLGTLGGNNSEAYGINNLGQVVGYADLKTNGVTHAFRIAAGQSINAAGDLGTLGGSTSYARSLNELGAVVGASCILGGTCQPGDKTEHAFRTATNSPINAANDLGTLDGVKSHGIDVNGNGDVVGFIIRADSTRRAFVYSSGTLIDLNTTIRPTSGWVLQEARGINDSGQIVGKGLVNGQTHAFLLTLGEDPLPPGDMNGDFDVDNDDLVTFEACMTGPELGPVAGNCARGDIDKDTDVDQADFGLFQRCYRGSSDPVGLNCAD